MKTFHRPGLPVRVAGAPRQVIGDGPRVERIALLADDLPGLRPEPLVAPGDRVAAGTPLMRDRHVPEILVTAPVAATVEEVRIGARRRLAAITLRREGERTEEFAPPSSPDRAAAVALLMRAGLWPAFRRRPFGHVPSPDEVPGAIFVTALDTRPLAPDPAIVIAASAGAFARGAELLPLLSGGPVHVCQRPGAPLVQGGGIACAAFTGAHPAGLAGTHVDALFPLIPGRVAWTIEAQDVIAIGHLLETGAIPGERVISLAGPGIAAPRLVRVPEGAALDELVAGGLTGGPMRLLSGDPLGGVESAFLRRGHRQVTVLPRPETTAPRAPRWPFAGAPAPRPAALIPTEALEAALGPRLPVAALLRALSVGDSETASRLGAHGLIEEDMALARYAAGGMPDFPALLRRSLDMLAEGAA